jgi:hypothetical protein
LPLFVVAVLFRAHPANCEANGVQAARAHYLIKRPDFDSIALLLHQAKELPDGFKTQGWHWL